MGRWRPWNDVSQCGIVAGLVTMAFVSPAANDDFLIEAAVKRFGQSSAYVECRVTFVGSGEPGAYVFLEFAF